MISPSSEDRTDLQLDTVRCLAQLWRVGHIRRSSVELRAWFVRHFLLSISTCTRLFEFEKKQSMTETKAATNHFEALKVPLHLTRRDKISRVTHHSIT